MIRRILLIGSDQEFLLSLANYLNKCDGIEAKTAQSVHEAFASAQLHHFSSAVIDEPRSGTSGPALCQDLRRQGFASPIFYAAPRDAEGEIILALEAGATAVLTRPIRARELLARLRYRSRLLERGLAGPIALGETTFDPQRRLLFFKQRVIPLTATESQILVCLGQAPGHAVTSDEIARTVWGNATRKAAGRLKCHVYRLRRKVGKSIKILTTSKGYWLDV